MAVGPFGVMVIEQNEFGVSIHTYLGSKLYSMTGYKKPKAISQELSAIVTKDDTFPKLPT